MVLLKKLIQDLQKGSKKQNDMEHQDVIKLYLLIYGNMLWEWKSVSTKYYLITRLLKFSLNCLSKIKATND